MFAVWSDKARLRLLEDRVNQLSTVRHRGLCRGGFVLRGKPFHLDRRFPGVAADPHRPAETGQQLNRLIEQSRLEFPPIRRPAGQLGDSLQRLVNVVRRLRFGSTAGENIAT